jgi:hypothetical protein
MKNNFCENCGNKITEEMKFCMSCGCELNNSQQEVIKPVNTQNTTESWMHQNINAPLQNNPLPHAYLNQPQQPMPTFLTKSNSTTDPTLAPLSTGQFIITFIILSIPVIGFIALMVWAFGSNVNRNKKSYARAVLIMMIITSITVFLLWSSVIGIILELMK